MSHFDQSTESRCSSPADPGRAPETPLVTVVVPAYNAARTLAATLDSLLAQTLQQFEAIVVDDGSTDATPAIARSYAQRDRRLRVVTRPNSGVADARNTGIRCARAPLVSSLDADDVWHPTFLAKLHAALAAAGDGAVFAYANFRQIDLDGNVVGSAPSYDVSGHAFHRFLLKNFVGNGSGMMFRRDLALAVGGYERRLQHEFAAQGCEDWLLQMRLCARGRVAAVSEYLVGYRFVPGGMSADPVRMKRSRIRAFEILFDELGCRDTLPARWALARAHAECMLRECLAGRLPAALRRLPQALRRDPWGTLATVVEGVLEGSARALRMVRPRRLRALRAFHEHGPLEDRRSFAPRFLARRLSIMTEMDRGVAAAGPAIPLLR